MKDPALEKLNLKNPIHLAAVGFGSGLAPFAPGTFGTLAAIPFYLLLTYLSWTNYLIFVCVTSLIGWYICDKTARDMQSHDHGSIVWDEFVGYWICLILVHPANWLTIVAAFVLFRFFDILKPWPISYLDKNCKGGFGIMIDDVAAGLVVMLILYYSKGFLL